MRDWANPADIQYARDKYEKAGFDYEAALVAGWLDLLLFFPFVFPLDQTAVLACSSGAQGAGQRVGTRSCLQSVAAHT